MQKAELDAALAPPEDRERVRDELNAQAMSDPRLQVGMVAPPPPKKA